MPNLLAFILLTTIAGLHDPLEPGARLLDTMSKLLTMRKFYGYQYENMPPTGDDLVKIIYRDPSAPPATDFVNLLRTYDAPKSSAFSFTLCDNSLAQGSRLPVYDWDGDYVDRQVLSPPGMPDYKYIDFAPYELDTTAILMVEEVPLAGSGSNYNQAIYLERGWNLVSWYVIPPDPNAPPLVMDDLFNTEELPWGPQTWFLSEFTTEPTDKVGRYNETPNEPDPHFYPEFGGGTNGWQWSPRYAYPIYLETGSHFWDFQNQALYTGADPFDDFIPNDAWDDYTQAGIPNTPGTTYWFFISYPQRMWLKVRESNTIEWLTTIPSNRLRYIKDDNGQFYNVSDPDHSTLEYLQPGKGYFLGYGSGDQVQNCPWFFDEVGVPAALPSELDPNQNTTFSAPHYQYKSRTHWWYPIEIDTIAVEGLTPASGDEIAVFCGDLCVGAMVFEGQYPLYLAAWMDDVATPDSLDGYLVAQEMAFKWFDVSANQELTFVPPPETQAMEADPYFPTLSGFGTGFAAKRSLVNGIQNVLQLPQEYWVGDCYPNPFNAETVIPLQLPQRSDVKIELYDLRGCKLATLYQGMQNAGLSKIHYRATGLASGVYFFRVTALGLERGGRFVDVGKMLVLK